MDPSSAHTSESHIQAMQAMPYPQMACGPIGSTEAKQYGMVISGPGPNMFMMFILTACVNVSLPFSGSSIIFTSRQLCSVSESCRDSGMGCCCPGDGGHTIGAWVINTVLFLEFRVKLKIIINNHTLYK